MANADPQETIEFLEGQLHALGARYAERGVIIESYRERMVNALKLTTHLDFVANTLAEPSPELVQAVAQIRTALTDGATTTP